MFEEESNPAKIDLRPAKFPDDEEFLQQAYFGTRTEDAALWSVLGEDHVKFLLEMQYKAQMLQYAQSFPNAVYSVVLLDEIQVGRYITAENEREICGVDLAILPEWRNRGIGTKILETSLRKAAETNRVFTFQVLKTNRAIRLYDRLGCKIVADNDSHFMMEWQKTPSK